MLSIYICTPPLHISLYQFYILYISSIWVYERPWAPYHRQRPSGFHHKELATAHGHLHEAPRGLLTSGVREEVDDAIAHLNGS